MKKVYVKKDDYDTYSIRVPLTVLMRRKRKSFVRSELEKVHPRFSLSSCVDSKIKIDKKGFSEKVTVMDFGKLCEYRSENPGKRLFLEENKESVFGKKISFKKTAILSLIAVFAFVLIKVCDRFLLEEEQPIVEVVDAAATLLAPQELFAVVLSSVKEKGGHISNLSWQNGRCSMSIVGCNNEDIAYANYCVVSYSSGCPQFNLVSRVNERKLPTVATIPVTRTSDGLVQSDYSSIKDIIKVLRSIVVLGSGDVLSEHQERNSAEISFVCNESYLKKIMENIGTALLASGWIENSLLMENVGGFVSVKFSARDLGGNITPFETPISVISKYSDVFFQDEQSSKNSKTNIEQIIEKKADKTTIQKIRPILAKNEQSRERVGAIKRGNSLFVFYRGNDGRLVKEIVNE